MSPFRFGWNPPSPLQNKSEVSWLKCEFRFHLYKGRMRSDDVFSCCSRTGKHAVQTVREVLPPWPRPAPGRVHQVSSCHFSSQIDFSVFTNKHFIFFFFFLEMLQEVLNTELFSFFCRYLFSLQMKRDLMEGRLICSENTGALLASHLVQCRFLLCFFKFNSSKSLWSDDTLWTT